MATRSTEETISEIENPWFRLGAAMLHYAILDARRGDPQAKAWLLSVDSVSYTHLTLPTNREV